MNDRPMPTQAAFRLMNEGNIALSQVEAWGIRIDRPKLRQTIAESQKKLKSGVKRLKQTDEWEKWKRRFGSKARLSSRQQLGTVMFDILGHDSEFKTETGQASTKAEHLEKLDIPFVRNYIRVAKLGKVLSTYLINIDKLTADDDILHPSFALHLVKTYRSSSSNPNFQNITKRNKQLAKLVRSVFIPRNEEYSLVEIDYKAVEVAVAACYHKDPTMVDYVTGGGDMHKDTAKDIFKVTDSQLDLGGKIRTCAKGCFVFPAFYGDYHGQMAPAIWDEIHKEQLTLRDGTPMFQHLSNKGFKTLDDFTQHVKKAEDIFWHQRFPVYTQWKYDWWNRYQKRGWCKTKTGFVVHGTKKKNQIINAPIQGSAFHCLLWALARVVEWLKDTNKRSMVIGQVHDSMLLDVHKDEFDEVLDMVYQISMIDIRKLWKWIIVPLDGEAECSDKNWFDVKEINFGPRTV